MDIQSSDGRALLLKYASSYVTKMKDHERFVKCITFPLYITQQVFPMNNIALHMYNPLLLGFYNLDIDEHDVSGYTVGTVYLKKSQNLCC